MTKLFCYVDETGQDTLGRFFIVATIVLGKERDSFVLFLEEAEQKSGKKLMKWLRAKAFPKRVAHYLELVFTALNFRGKVFYQVFRDTKDYDHLLPQAIAAAVKRYCKTKGIGNYQAVVVIDALRRTEQAKVKRLLKRHGLHVEKVRGLRDEGDAIIRLADAVAGLVREAEEGRVEWILLRNRLEKQEILTKVEE